MPAADDRREQGGWEEGQRKMHDDHMKPADPVDRALEDIHLRAVLLLMLHHLGHLRPRSRGGDMPGRWMGRGLMGFHLLGIWMFLMVAMCDKRRGQADREAAQQDQLPDCAAHMHFLRQSSLSRRKPIAPTGLCPP